MKKPSCRTRNYHPDDFAELAALYIRRARERGRTITFHEVSRILKRPGFNPEKDLLVALVDNELIGYAQATPETGISRLLISGWIDPAFRRKGLASDMLDMILNRARELGVRLVSTSVSQENRSARAILPKLGFTYVRRYLDFGIDSADILDISLEEVCPECRMLRPGEEIRIMELQNRIFSGHWRYNHYDLDTFLYDINLNNRASEDIAVYCDGETISGYCWTELMELTDVSGTESVGIINMLGVEEDHRRKGIGRKVLTAGLVYLKLKGVKFVSLQVDSENTAARDLYRSAGFREYGSILWYEREVPQETATGKLQSARRNSLSSAWPIFSQL